MERFKKLNYLTFAITKNCNFRCPYCSSSGAGEAQFSKKRNADINLMIEIAKSAQKKGITRFRISGGEPFLHPKLDAFIRELSELNVQIILDTNATKLDMHPNLISDPPKGLEIVCSLDGLDDRLIKYHSGNKNQCFEEIHQNISKIKDKNLLKRINCVITKENYLLIPELIEFCKNSLQCNLKLSGIAKRRNQNYEMDRYNDIFFPTNYVLSWLESNGKKIIEEFDYSQLVGTSCNSYQFDNIVVKIKGVNDVATYDFDGVCKKCRFFPCSEGLYMITALPDGQLSGCQMNGFSLQIKDDLYNNFKSGLNKNEFTHYIDDMVEKTGGPIDRSRYIDDSIKV